MKKSKWILVAEDDEPVAELTTLALTPEKQACDVVVARDGMATLDCLHYTGDFQERNTGNPMFVLLDLKMPKVDGLEVLRHIRSDPSLKIVPVVIFTSSREITDVDRCYQMGANAYVVKPVDFEEFSKTLQRIREFWADVNEVPPEEQPVQTRPIASLKTHAPGVGQ